jgi:lipoprotein
MDMKQILLALLSVFALASCHESIEERAQREAKAYTEKYCPTPVNNFTRTDSVVFYPATKTYHYFCTFNGRMDNAEIIAQNQAAIRGQLLKAISESTELKAYKDAGFVFAYTCHSEKHPRQVLFEAKYTAKEYQ